MGIKTHWRGPSHLSDLTLCFIVSSHLLFPSKLSTLYDFLTCIYNCFFHAGCDRDLLSSLSKLSFCYRVVQSIAPNTKYDSAE